MSATLFFVWVERMDVVAEDLAYADMVLEFRGATSKT